MGDKYVVTGDQYLSIDRKVADIRRQLLLERGSPLDPETVDQVMQYVGEGRSADLLASLTEPAATRSTTAALSEPYPVTVNFGRSPKTMAKVGNYPGGYNLYYDGMNWSEWEVPEGSTLVVPKRGKVDKELLLFHVGAYFGGDTYPTTEEVTQVLVGHGLVLEPAQTVPALGEKYPDLDLEFPVIALGSFWVGPHGCRRVAVLWGGADERHLGLDWDDYQWYPYYRILVSRA